MVQIGVLPENIYAMDESRFSPGHQRKERVVGHRGTKTQHKQGGADHENITALITICADSSALPPMIIYKGQNFMTKWGDNNIANAAYVYHLCLSRILSVYRISHSSNVRD